MSWLGSDDFDAAVVLKETNSARLWVEVLRLAKHHVDTGAPLIVTPEQLCRFNSIAMHGLISRAGSLRDDDNGIFGAAHKPPPHQAVPQLVDECCAYINREHQSPLHPAAYALWRINFIHPFDDGNGRVSRALCYLVFCAKAGFMPPGRVALPERILARQRAYQNVLADADRAWVGSHKGRRNHKVSVKNIETFLDSLIRAQARDDP